jgi:NADP-dependent 3-hydroxy acid dehydrogenase YdfG
MGNAPLFLRLKPNQYKRRYFILLSDGSVVVITGASKGIGQQVAYRYASRNAKLVLAARSEEELLKVKEQCQ